MSRRALVTGADGFLGSRLVPRLAADGWTVRALVRRGIGRVAPAGVERVWGDVNDAPSLRAATEGCERVFHCAWGGMSMAEGTRINVDGTRNVIEAAAAAGVGRVVHVSTMAVHRLPTPAELTEDHPLVTRGDAYSATKAAGERTAFEVGAARGVEVTALRPTIVYGPRAPVWTLTYFQRTHLEQLLLVDGGAGWANLVHVEDLVDALVAAAQRPEAAGQAFLISGEHPVTWREYIGAFARMCGKPLPPSVPSWWAPWEALWQFAYGMLTDRPRRLTRVDAGIMSSRTRVSIAKAQRLLGYAPRYTLDRGMVDCEAWLRESGYLPRRARAA